MTDIVERALTADIDMLWRDMIAEIERLRADKTQIAEVAARLRAALDGLLTEARCWAVDPPSAALNYAIEEAIRALEPKP